MVPICTIVAIIITLIVIYYLVVPNKERFTVARRDYLLCPYIRTDDEKLLPNTVVFVIQGYNYTDTPIIYRGLNAVVPMQYFWDSDSMTYYLTVASPRGLCSDRWTIQTSEDVRPIVTEGYSKKQMLLKQADPQFRSVINTPPSTILWSLSC